MRPVLQPVVNSQTMPISAPSKFGERTLLNSGFVWPRRLVARPWHWRKVAHRGLWSNLVWKWDKFGISASGRAAAKRLELFPSQVFAHPDIISEHPEMSEYYRLMAFLPKRGLPQIKSPAGTKEIVTFCRVVNRRLSCLVAAAAKASGQNRLNPILAGAGKIQSGLKTLCHFT